MEKIKNWWRNRGRRWWSDYHWPILLTLLFTLMILGVVGFAKNAVATGEERSILDNIYLALGLISLNSGAVSPPISWELQLARFMIPALAAYTAIFALVSIFTQQTQQVRLWFMRDHVIICGLGRKDSRLAKQFLTQGEKVVVIEANEENPWIETIQAAGGIVLTGDARDAELLLKARINDSSYLIAGTGNDGVNAEIAVQAEALTKKRKNGILTCTIHIVDPQLWYLLREKELEITQNTHFRLELFNIFDRGARIMLKQFSPWGDEPDAADSLHHLVIIGLGKLGQSLTMQAALQWREMHQEKEKPLRLTLIDLDAETRFETLKIRYPDMVKACTIEPLPMNVDSPEFMRGDFLFDPNGKCGVDGIYICLDNDTLGLHCALNLNRVVMRFDVPIIIRMAEEAGLALLMQNTHQDGAFENIHVFSLLDETCTVDLIRGGTHEVLARDLHFAYLEGVRQKKREANDDPALVPWEQLPEYIKEKNRRQADHIPLMLNAAGYRIAPLKDWDASRYTFKEDEILIMAPLEHKRWCEEKIADGWRYGPEKDEKLKTNPDLVAWEDLPPEEIEKNKKYIRDLPKVLAKAGFQVEPK